MRGKRFCTRGGVQVRQIEIDERIFGAADFHFMHDGPRHHVARRQFRQRMVFPHEAIHLDISQITAFTRSASESRNRGVFFMYSTVG